ncbi:hypothetical protein BKA82DRAFT_4364597 [Pisolithus tinctorius]|nr:hypothetical protein BKA82DRAFT_4364597 [Pisolithus tinctorius]
MSLIKVSCGYCKASLTPFVCKSGSHSGQWCARCFAPHLPQGGRPYWYFWPPGDSPQGGSLPSSPLVSVTPLVSAAPLSVPAVLDSSPPVSAAPSSVPPPVTKQRVQQPSASSLLQSVPLLDLKSHAEPADVIDLDLLDSVNDGVEASLPSLDVVQGNISASVIDPALSTDYRIDNTSASECSSRSIARTLAKLNAGPLIPTSPPVSTSPPLEPQPNYKPLLVAARRSSLLTAVSLPPKSSQRQPKITTQMNATWAAEYKFGSVQLSAKAQRDKERLAGELASKRCIDLIYWDRDYGSPTIMALQGTNGDDSDIPHWPDFALTHVSTLLPSLGNDIMAVEWLNPSLLIWKTITRLNYSFRVKNGDALFLRRKGVVHCDNYEKILQKFHVNMSTPPRLFKNLKGERKSVARQQSLFTSRQAYLAESDDDSDANITSPFVTSPFVTSSPFPTVSPSFPTSQKCSRSHACTPSLEGHHKRPNFMSALEAADSSSADTLSSTEATLSAAASSDTSPSCTPAINTIELPSPLLPTTSLPSTQRKLHTAWPTGEYVVDIVAGMEAMGKPKMKHLSVPQRFEAIFGRAFIWSTYHDACRRWQLAPLELHEELLKAGRTPEGCWDMITRAVKLKRAKQPLFEGALVDIDLTSD